MSGYAHRACPVVLSAPSGTGKTTIARALVSGWEYFEFSVSATTRPPRQGERDGVDYHFRDRAAFQDMVDRGVLAEWAQVHGHLYGTPRSELEGATDRGIHKVLDIDVQGARQIRASVPEAVLVFVMPPSGDILVHRLTGRGTEPADVVRRRMATALEELRAVDGFDYVVVNDDLDRVVGEIGTIVRAECFRTSRVKGLDEVMEGLRESIDGFLRHGISSTSP